MPQPMSTPTAAGMIAPLRRDDAARPSRRCPTCTSGITATHWWMNGSGATRCELRPRLVLERHAAVHALIGTPPSTLMTSWVRRGRAVRVVGHATRESSERATTSRTPTPTSLTRGEVPRPAQRSRVGSPYPSGIRSYSIGDRGRAAVDGHRPARPDARSGKRAEPLGARGARRSALCQHEDLLVDRLELLHQRRLRGAGAQRSPTTSAQVSPETEVRLPRDRARATRGTSRRSTARSTTSRAATRSIPDAEDYLVHITTGTHVAQICLFLLTESRHIPGAAPPDRRRRPRRERGRGGHLHDHRPRPLAVRPHRARASRRSSTRASRSSSRASTRGTRRSTALIERIEQVAIASRDPLLLSGPTGAGKSQLARRIYELKKARRQVGGRARRGQLRDAARRRRHVRALRPREGRVHRRGRGPPGPAAQGRRRRPVPRRDRRARPRRAGDAAPRASRRSASSRSAPTRRCSSDFQLIAGTNRDLAAARRARPLPRGPPRAHRPVDVPPARPARAARGHRAEPRLRARTCRRRPEAARDVQPRGAGALPRLRALGRGALGGQLPRLQRRGPPHGDAGRRRPHQRRRGRRRDRAPARHWRGRAGGRGRRARSGRRPRSLARRRAPAALDRFDRVQLAEVVRVCRAARSLSEAGRALFAASRAARATTNDADRLRKYLARFGLTLQAIQNG